MIGAGIQVEMKTLMFKALDARLRRLGALKFMTDEALRGWQALTLRNGLGAALAGIRLLRGRINA
jgi:hypothetical protein